MTKPVRRYLPVAVLVGLVAGGLAYAFRPQPVAVDLAEVASGPMVVTVDEDGWTRVRELFTVSAPVSGRVLRVDVHAGDRVSADSSAIAVIQPTDPSLLDLRTRAQAEAQVEAAEAALALAEAALAKATAELDFARTDLRRAEALAEKGTIPTRTLERAAIDVQTQEAAVAAAEADRRLRLSELETARAALIEPGDPRAEAPARCCVYVRSPVDGVVLRVLHESEGVISAGTPIAEVGDVRDLEIVVEPLSIDAVHIEPGAPAIIEGWGGEPLDGRVRRVEPYGFTKVSALGIEEQRVRVILDLVEPSESRSLLGHGYRVKARIVVWQRDPVTQVPISALFRIGADWAVFVEEGGRAVERRVAVGHANGSEAEILEGLRPGERVILHPSDRVASGTLVVPRSEVGG